MNKRFVPSILLLALIVLLSGCAGATLSVLKKDQIDSDNGIAMIHVRIKDPTSSFKYTVLSVEGEGDGISTLTVFKNAWTQAGQYYGWEMQNGVNVFDHYFFVEGKPGRYFLDKITAGYAHLGEYNQGYFFEFPLYRAFDLKKDGVVICEVVDFTVTNVEKKGNGNPSINYQFGFTQSNAETAAAFKSSYPSLYTTYVANRPASGSFFGYHANLTKREGHKEWADYEGGNFSASRINGGLMLQGKEQDKYRHSYTSAVKPINLPKNMNLETAIRWADGMKDASYGLRIAIDAKNAYYLGVSASGASVIWIMKNGAFLPNPAIKHPGLLYASRDRQDVFRVESVDGQVSFRINNQVIGTFKGALDISSAYIGYFVSGTQKVFVDDIQILESR
jgi:hypothetical protein